MQLNECINFMLTNVQNAVFLCFKKQLQQYNVTPIQYALLKCLWDEDEQAPSQLAQRLYLDSSTVTGIMSRLEEGPDRPGVQQDRPPADHRLPDGRGPGPAKAH